jgi:Fe-S cluster assembly iron-binding protein IscA
VRFTRLRDRRSAASGRRAGRSASETAARVVLFGRPGCHLCDDARVVVERVTTELGERYEERDITLDPNDLQAYVESIPVVLVDGVQVDFWRVSEDRLRAALLR